MILDRIRTKILNLEKIGVKPQYIVLSNPPALELYYLLRETNEILMDKKLDFEEMKKGRLFNVRLIVLQSNKEIIEVG